MTKKELTKIVKEALEEINSVKTEELSAWDKIQAERKKKAEEYRKQRDEKVKAKGADSSMKITKEHLTRIVKEAVEEVEGESWWDKKKKELEDKKEGKEEMTEGKNQWSTWNAIKTAQKVKAAKKKELEDKKKEKSDDGEVKKENWVRGKGIASPSDKEKAAQPPVKKEELSITKEHLMKIIREEVEKLMEEPQVSSGVQGAGEEEDKGEHYQSTVMEEADSVKDELRSGSNTRETEDYSETPPRTLKESRKSVLLARPKGK